MIFSYRTRRVLRRFAGILAAVLAVGLLAAMCWLLWLQRFVVYTPQGAQLDFNLPKDPPQGVMACPPAPSGTFPVIYGKEEDPTPTPEAGMTQLQGYYVTIDELVADVASVEQQILALPEGTPVLLDIKGTWGYFFYSTKVGYTTSGSFDMAVMDAFFSAILSKDLYAIARMPAFLDYDFARKNVSCGLPKADGSLWLEENRGYWLDPADDMVLTYLIDVTKELQSMGFDEVVYKEFCFPDTDQIVFEGDRAQAIAKAARTLVTTCAGEGFTVSFLTSDTGFQLPQGNCRMYWMDVPASEVADLLGRLSVTDPATQVVFLAQSNDTRYDVSGVLRPLHTAY